VNPFDVLKQFIEYHALAGQPVGLGLSGGPDSTALFHLLHQMDVQLHLLHVNHGYRKESDDEAKVLQDQANELGVPLHMKGLEKAPPKGNLEAYWREERLKFFKEISKKASLRGVFLAHTEEDQLETLLKQLLESGRVDFVRGMEPVATRGELTLYRPLLSVKKQVLVDLLEAEKRPYFLDPSNGDERFLRARMRKKVFPFLKEQFGKELASPLLQLVQEMREREEVLHHLLKPWTPEKVEGPMGTCYDFSAQFPSERGVQKALIRKILLEENAVIPEQRLESLIDWIAKGAQGKQILLTQCTLLVDRARLFFLHSLDGVWKLEKGRTSSKKEQGWKGVFSGESHLSHPRQLSYELQRPLEFSREQKKRRESLSKSRVPPFLRAAVPLVLVPGKAPIDPLDEESQVTYNKEDNITLKYELQ